jgi:hypothetical protein
MDNAIILGLFSDKTFYAAHFMDLSLWEPFVRLVCERHGFGYKQGFPGLPGTFPTFIVEPYAERTPQSTRLIVVKFFGPLFEGADSFYIEKAMGQWLTRQSLPLRSPAILAEGQLSLDWSYLILDHIPGVSIGQVRQQLSAEAWESVAQQMGGLMKALHTATATSLPVIPMQMSVMTWVDFIDFLEQQRVNCHANHQRWNDLPPHLLEQVPDFISPVEQLVDFSSLPYLIHADLTADHLYGRLDAASMIAEQDGPAPAPASQWHSLAIIDWGDTRVGNILYELVALHLDLFQADKHLLRVCLQVYDLPDFYRQDFPRKALSMVLLHQFPMPARIYAPHQDIQSLHELAERLFGL